MGPSLLEEGDVGMLRSRTCRSHWWSCCGVAGVSVVSACLSALVSIGVGCLLFVLLVGRWFMLVVSPAFDVVVWVVVVIVFVVGGRGVDGCRPAVDDRPGGWCCLVLGVRRGLLLVVGVGCWCCGLLSSLFVGTGGCGVEEEWGRGVGGRR